MRLLTLLVLLLITLPLAAQKKASKERSCRIIYLSAPAGAPTKLHLFDGKTSQEVELPRMNLSGPYTLPPGRLNLRMVSEPVANPKKLPKGAPHAVVTTNVRDFYLLVTTDSKNTIAPVSLRLINANTDRFSNGQILWLNLSPHTVKGTVGNQKLRLPPQSRRIIKPPANSRATCPVDLSFIITGDKRRHPLCETSWLHDPRTRMIAFVFTEKGRRTPRVLAFPDSRPPPKKGKP
jgi:hypothetical protein